MTPIVMESIRLKICKLDGCDRPHKGKGFCDMHLKRFRKWGDPLGGTPHFKDAEESFAYRVKTDPESGCHIWTGATSTKGYGIIYLNNVGTGAHIYAWNREHGPVTTGMVLDHICHNRKCVNPNHLRETTQRNNARYRTGASKSKKSCLPRGVTRNGKKFMARVWLHDKNVHLGTYATPEEAAEVAHQYRLRVYGDYAGGI